MRSPNTCTDKFGFTIIEILLVMGILATVISVGSIVGIEAYHREIYISQEREIITLLNQTRMNAINNISGQAQGIRFTPNKIVVFQGLRYEESPHTHQSYNFAILSEMTQTVDIVFKPLDAQVLEPANITLNQNGHHTAITVNKEGQISW